jgi:hypothetical protein
MGGARTCRALPRSPSAKGSSERDHPKVSPDGGDPTEVHERTINGSRIEAIAQHRCDPDADFAVLKFLTPLSPDFRHIPLIDKTFRQEQFYSPGYPNDIDETDFFTISGTVTEPNASIKPNITSDPVILPTVRRESLAARNEWISHSDW